MLLWRGKSSSKDARKKTSKESLIDTLHRKFKIPSESKPACRSGGSQRRGSDTVSEKGPQSQAQSSRSPSPSKQVSRCQSFVERACDQPLPLPGLHRVSIDRTDSGISVSAKPRFEKGSKQSLFLPVPRPGCIRNRPDPTDLDGDLVTASVSSECSTYSDDPADSRQHSPLALDYENGSRTAAGSPSSMMANDQSSVTQINSREALKPAGKPYTEPPLLGSGHCSSPGSGHNSGHNSMGGDMSGQLFWQPSRGSPEYSPIPSPRMASPGPSSRIHSGAVTPLHPRAGGATTESQTS
ncbi:hypothetical protein F0562_031219 [Nyssa sinensis]|uniref:Uncharacterized protein n=1 Tax=Nyssa sinensis TaxID=561372 RepID=A0A5J5AVC1_9ASTE|nr:hypothetical protein F0562_031219 [Nyssa sinensis]